MLYSACCPLPHTEIFSLIPDKLYYYIRKMVAGRLSIAGRVICCQALGAIPKRIDFIDRRCIAREQEHNEHHTDLTTTESSK